jgi:serine/threonine protein kinase
MATALASKFVGRYKKISTIAVTRFSQVFRVWDPDGKTKYVMKVVPQDRNQGSNEASILSTLSHPYIIPLVEAFDWESDPILILPSVTGGTLKDARERNQLTVVQVTEIMFRTLLAIQYLHDRNIVHGDISPNNIMLHNDKPLIIDFGTAEMLKENELSQSNVGTGRFVAPERRAKKGTSAADIYSLGATFCYLAEGNDSFCMTNSLWKDAPRSLRNLVARMMRMPPANRPVASECLGDVFFLEVLSEKWIAEEKEAMTARPSGSSS